MNNTNKFRQTLTLDADFLLYKIKVLNSVIELCSNEDGLHQNVFALAAIQREKIDELTALFESKKGLRNVGTEQTKKAATQ